MTRSAAGFNGRLGYTFTSGSVHSFNASFEVSPCFYEENGASGRITNIALIIGYQHL